MKSSQNDADGEGGERRGRMKERKVGKVYQK